MVCRRGRLPVRHQPAGVAAPPRGKPIPAGGSGWLSEPRRFPQTPRISGQDLKYNNCTIASTRQAGPAEALRTLGWLLERGLADLSASEQAIYLRLLWHAGLGPGTCRCGIERLAASTGLSRVTVIQALCRLQARGLVRRYTREPKRQSVWLVEVPRPGPPPLPEPLRAERPAGRDWLVDRLDPEDLDLVRSLVAHLLPSERERLEREARERLGAEDPEDVEKAVVELVVRERFGPARLAKYMP